MTTNNYQKPLFNPGRCVTTPGADECLDLLDQIVLVNRHVRGDFGHISAEDWDTNLQAVKGGDRILSSYLVNGQKIWIITEADRSTTTILLPSEY